MNFYDNKKVNVYKLLIFIHVYLFFLSFYKFFTELTVTIIHHLASHNVV